MINRLFLFVYDVQMCASLGTREDAKVKYLQPCRSLALTRVSVHVRKVTGLVKVRRDRLLLSLVTGNLFSEVNRTQ